MEKQEQEDFIAKLVSFDTVGGKEDQVAKFLKAEFDKRNIPNKIIPVQTGRSNFYAEIGNGNGKVIAFEGHQDVVGLVNKSAWKHDPFGAEIEDGKMYGRGTTDMKGGLAAECIAMFELAASNATINGKIKLLATVGEETSPENHMQGAQKFTEEGYLNDVEGLLIAEPSMGKINFANKGSITYKVLSKGKAAHSSMPWLGYNAITPLIDFYNEQQKYFATLHAENKYLGKTIPVMTKIEGGQQLNSVPDRAAIYAKVRTIPEESNETILQHIKTIIAQINQTDKAQLSLEILGDKIPVVSDPQNKFTQLVKQIAERELNQELKLEGSAGGTDASEMIHGNPNMNIAVLGPGNDSAHKIDEYVELDTFHKDITIYKKLVLQYLS
ncbi:ArgE/DapE family deacylase [Paucilactobacillus wasatchensis]|uniref:Probable succinyl-diaminopimelate desuccinylase n=1 Tax=Paucilactobacillus wasatchensis TaxID=1335616 RepID=A0A0D1A668_9LACO|nr:ArgE/DapE family deacylase [Paucilactobacillus wasatchensis]KIS03400.1 Acetylornithine deacetylase [Paucilactobacillus wasatchensis]